MGYNYLYFREDDFTYEEMEFPHSIHIVGFVAQTDIKSPACVSRHLVLPLKASEYTEALRFSI